MTEPSAAVEPPEPDDPGARSPGRRALPFALAIGGGCAYFLGFAGFDVWPLIFVALVPLLAALELERARGAPTSRALGLGALYGFVVHAGGFYWLVGMLEIFSGFGVAASALFAGLYFAAHGLEFLLLAWLFVRARERGWPVTPVIVAGFAAQELLVPNIFPSFVANALHELPVMFQTADLGGPILAGVVVVIVNGALFEVGEALVRRRRIPAAAPIAAAVWLALTAGYGAIRMGQIDARAAAAERMTIGIVQANMGVFDIVEHPEELHRRNLEASLALEREAPLDLLLWPESAYGTLIERGVRDLRPHVTTLDTGTQVLGPLRTPLLFGGLTVTPEGQPLREHNTAFLLDEGGRVLGTYDKTYLLVFGEYLPLGEALPVLYEWSPNSSRLTPGDHVRPLALGERRITTLVCYEDVLPGFTRRAVATGAPDLLVNLTYDGWFGDTTEPDIHFALAKLRAVEHRRFLARATTTGVSGVIDACGRVVTRSGVMTREALTAAVPLMREPTVYESLGDWPGLVGALLAALFAFAPRRAVTARLRLTRPRVV